MFADILVLVRNVSTFCTARYTACALAMCLILAPVWADQAQAQADLTVHVIGFDHRRGQEIASLFRDGEGVFGKPYARLAAEIQQGKATLSCVFPSRWIAGH